MSKVTKAEKWFGKKKNDLTSEELKEFWRLEAKERRKLPKVQEYRKQYQKQYQKDNKEKINQSIKEWKQNNPEKVKSYRYAKLNREIEVLKKSLKETTDLMQNYLMENLELQEKLAEKEKIIEIQHNGIGYWKSVAEKRPDIDYVVKIKDLKQQLAEKEKEIEKWKTKWCESEINSLRLYEQNQNNNQDKSCSQ